MRFVLRSIALCFFVLALFQLNDPDAVRWFSLYAVGGFMTGLSLLPDLPRAVVRCCAVATALIMFFYFFGFFQQVPAVAESGWRSEVGFEAMGLLFSSFAMCPVLAQFSCRLKAIVAASDRSVLAVFSAKDNF